MNAQAADLVGLRRVEFEQPFRISKEKSRDNPAPRFRISTQAINDEQ